MTPGSPRQIYDQRLQARKLQRSYWQRWSHRIANLRLLVFLIGAVGVALVLSDRLAAGWLVGPAVVFLILIVLHDHIDAHAKQSDLSVEFFARGLDRLDGRWAGQGAPGIYLSQRLGADRHPYAQDLDLFGPGSLFELLCTARTRIGQRTLAQWLLTPASTAEVKGRHQAIAALRDRLDLREDLARLGEHLRTTVQASTLGAWGEAPPVFSSPYRFGVHALAAVISGATLIALGGWLGVGWSPAGFVGLVGVEWLYSRFYKRRVDAVMAALTQPAQEIETLYETAYRLESEPLEQGGPTLTRLNRELTQTGLTATRIRQLGRRVAWLDALRNQAFLPLGFLLLWGIHWSLRVESWRTRYGPGLKRWIEALGELEALLALAAYAFEHPDDPFPVLVEPKAPDHVAPAQFEAEELGHPLLHETTCQRNSVRLDSQQPMLMVSGSNMSGKSTLLRTVGMNAVLAWAGAPVRAKSLTVTPLQVGATLRVHDSLQDGTSRFYAELKRLQLLLKISQPSRPVLFLLDELLHGTNSHDRRRGGEQFLQRLLRSGAVGLVTTHDLSLTEAADTLKATNMHFNDRLEEGRLHFDYRLKPGVVKSSNALPLMRQLGLVSLEPSHEERSARHARADRETDRA